MSLRALSFSIPSTTELKVTFSDNLSELITVDNFEVESLNGAVSNLEITKITITENIVVIKTRPQVSGNYYLLKFLDTSSVPFSSDRGQSILFDSNSRQLFFVGIDDVNPIRDRMLSSVPSTFEVDGTVIKNILSAQAEELYKAQKTIGQVLSNNYLSIDVVDELRTRSAGATDRLANENAYDIIRVSKNRTNEFSKKDILDYTSSNSNDRLQSLPYYPVSLQQNIVESEEISIDTENNNFSGLTLSVRKNNIIKLLSVTHIVYEEEEDCYGDIGTEYNIKKYKYSIADNFYDQEFAFSNNNLNNNQIKLSEFGNLPIPSILDKFIVTYLYKDLSRHVNEDTVAVSSIKLSSNESVPSNVTSFSLNYAPVINSLNKIGSIGDVQFSVNESSDTIPDTFKKEIEFNFNRLPNKLGEYAVNYQTGEVFLVGETIIGEGTGRNNFLATYFYRKEFKNNLDYTVSEQNFIATPNRLISRQEVEIAVEYDNVYSEGIDYKVSSHIEVMPEQVENRLSQSFKIKTKHNPITDVFRILNQATGEVYNLLYHTDSEISFTGNRSPEIKNIYSEEASFKNKYDEVLQVTGEFIVPMHKAIINSNSNNSSIEFSPGLPAELIDQDSDDYFVRILSDDDIQDINIRFFGTPDSNNLINSFAILSTVSAPSNETNFIIGTKAYIIELEEIGLLNKTLDAVGNVTNTSLVFDDTDIFANEKYFESIISTNSIIDTSSGGLSKAIEVDTEDAFFRNMTRLRIPGDFTVDYNHGIIYLSISKEQDVNLGKASYHYSKILTKHSNILNVSGINNKTSSSDSNSNIITQYNNFTHNETDISLQLDNGLIFYDGETKAYDADNNRQFVCTILSDYTVLVPNNIISINGIYSKNELTGYNLNSSNETHRIIESNSSDLQVLAQDDGKNYYNNIVVSYEKNIIDFKKYVKKVFYADGSNFKITISDNNIGQFISAELVATGNELFDNNLNVPKITDIQIANVINNTTTADVELVSGIDLSDITIGVDYLLDAQGNRFLISSVDELTSTLIVQLPADNNSSILEPAVDSSSDSSIVTKAIVTITNDIMTIEVPNTSSITSGMMVNICYVYSWVPSIGTQLAIDYKYGFVFIDYSYVYDNLAVWYEYGDNSIDWSISSTLSEGEDYYVTYKYGALRDALRINFGSLTNIPFFQNFSVNTNRELYRNAIKGVLQTFPKGPVIPAYKELVKSFTNIEPNVDEMIFGNWVLGRDYLNPGKVDYSGNIEFAQGKFNDGLNFKDGIDVTIPSISSISLDHGTVDVWIRPNWNGIDNDASITFSIDDIGESKFKLFNYKNPLENGWKLNELDNLIGGFDYLGGANRIYNYQDDGYSLSNGSFGLFYLQEKLDRTLNNSFNVDLKVNKYGLTLSQELSNISLNDSYNIGSVLINDSYKISGVDLNLNKLLELSVSDFDSDNDLIDNYNLPHPLRKCRCRVLRSVNNLSEFKNLSYEITFVENIEFSLNSINVIDNNQDSLLILDQSGKFYQVKEIYDNNNNKLKTLNGLISRIIVSKFPINFQNMSGKTATDINENNLTGNIGIYYKSIDILVNQNNSSDEYYDLKKNNMIDFTKFVKLKIDRIAKENRINFLINNNQQSMYYTDSINVFESNRLVDSDIGSMAGIYSDDLYSQIEFKNINGVLTNRYSLNDIYIGKTGYSPTKNPFTINKKDVTLVSYGEPANDVDSEGLFVWYDDNCTSELSSNAGRWIFRLRAKRGDEVPVDVNELEQIELTYQLTGTITTDGDFSSVQRSFRMDSNDNCISINDTNCIFRYCGNQLLEESGWNKIDESDSTLINTIVDGRHTSSNIWNKIGNFDTDLYSGIYKIGPSLYDINCVETNLSNKLFTKMPCTGSYEYLISLRVNNDDTDIIGTNYGRFNSFIAGNLNGIVPISIVEDNFNIKIALAYNDIGQGLIVLLNSSTNNIIDISNFDWNDLAFHEYKLIKDLINTRIYCDDTLLFELSNDYFDEFDAVNEIIEFYLFDDNLLDIELYHDNFSSKQIDINLINFKSNNLFDDSELESNDTIISTDSKIEFSFNIDSNDGYSYDGYDGYEYTYNSKIDEIIFTSDRHHYIVDSGITESSQRFSIFKDGKGFLNFRIYSDNNPQAAMFNLSTNIKEFVAGELHHIAASWKLNSIEEQDEMHLFIDGQEVPNLFKFGGAIPVNLNQKFKDVSKEILFNYLVNKIDFCNNYTATINAGLSTFTASNPIFTDDMIGRSILITDTGFSSALSGNKYLIKSVIDQYSVTLGSNDNLDLIIFNVSDSNVQFKLPPIAGVSSRILTDLKNSKCLIFRKDINDNEVELSGIYYTIEDNEIVIIKGDNVERPQFRVNLDQNIIEFIGQDSNCLYDETVSYSDLEVSIKTYGLNLENCKYTLTLSGSSYFDSGEFEGNSIIRTHGREPTSLSDVMIKRVLLTPTVIGVNSPTLLSENKYLTEYELSLEDDFGKYKLTSESGVLSKQNRGRKLSIRFDSDNINYCDFDGYQDGYQDGTLDANNNTITIYGTTNDGTNEETYYIYKNGIVNGTKYFRDIDRIESKLLIMDPDFDEAGLLEVFETDSIDVSNNNGSAAEVYKYRNGYFYLTEVGSLGLVPFEIPYGTYKIEYPSYLKIDLNNIGEKIFIGTDLNSEKSFDGVIDQFRILSQLSGDTRVNESVTSEVRSITEDFYSSNPYCPTTETLALINFDNPIDMQSRTLRKKEFLDEKNNIKYKLDSEQRESLLSVVNNQSKFMKKMFNLGFDYEKSIETYYEVHKAYNGPIFNTANYYRNFIEFPKSESSVNDLFLNSGNFTNGHGLQYLNNDGKFRKELGTIELWISPAIDTDVDFEKRYYLDIYSAKRERVQSINSTFITLANPAKEILSIKLLKKTKEFQEYYTADEAIIFDDISRSEISGVLSGGTGTDKDWSQFAKLSSDGINITLAESLPGQKIDVMITYIPLNTSGDRFSIYKNETNELVFEIIADGHYHVVSSSIDWRKNSWHRVMCLYRTGTNNDTMRLFVDGTEGGYIRYGTGIKYGQGYIYGQYIESGERFPNRPNININDEFRLISIGTDTFGSNNSRARIDNLRFSRILRGTVNDVVGRALDNNYTSNLNTVVPVVKDDATTFILDFDEDLKKIDKFITILDKKSGIYDFKIEVLDNFDKVINVNDGEIEDLIEDLVKRIKPSHTNAQIDFIKTKC